MSHKQLAADQLPIWTEEAVARWEQGERVQDLAKRFGVRLQVMCDVLRARLGGIQRLHLRYVRQQQMLTEYKDKVYRLETKGLTRRQIAKELGITLYWVDQIQEWQRRHRSFPPGWKPARRKKPPQPRRKAKPCERCMLRDVPTVAQGETEFVERYGLWLCALCQEAVAEQGERALPKIRRCLWCQEPFLSLDAAHRKCRKCKRMEGLTEAEQGLLQKAIASTIL